jgi:hypothetical protein
MMLENVKVGDKIIITGGRLNANPVVKKVARLTKNYVVVHYCFGKEGRIYNEYDVLFRKDNGYERAADEWWPRRAEPFEELTECPECREIAYSPLGVCENCNHKD